MLRVEAERVARDGVGAKEVAISLGPNKAITLMYAVGDRVILAFEPVVGQPGTARSVVGGRAMVLLDITGPGGEPILALVGFGERPPEGQPELDLHP